MTKKFVKNSDFNKFEERVSYVVNAVKSFYEDKNAHEASKVGLMPILSEPVNPEIRQMMRKICEVCQYELDILNGTSDDKVLIADIASDGEDEITKSISKVIVDAKDANDDEPLKEREFETLLACALLFSCICNAHMNVSDDDNENEIDKDIQRLFDEFEVSLIRLEESITTLNIGHFLSLANVDFKGIDKLAEMKIKMYSSYQNN